MNARVCFAATVALAAAAAPAAAPAPSALVNCGKLRAGGSTWQVAGAGVGCATARSIVRQVAVKKPDRVLHVGGGEVDQYAAPFSGLRCFESRKAKLGGSINCTSNDGKRSVLATYKG